MKKALIVALALLLIGLTAWGALDKNDYKGGVFWTDRHNTVLSGFTSTGLFDLVGGARFDNATTTTLTITETNITLVGSFAVTGAVAITGDVSIGAAGGNLGNDLFVYGKLDGSYLEWDEDANDAGRLKVVNASTRLSCVRSTVNECAFSVSQNHDTTAVQTDSQGGNATWSTYTLATANTNGSESQFTLMTGVHGDIVLNGTLNGDEVYAVGVMGEIRGAGAITECAQVAAVMAKNNNSVDPSAGIKSLFYGYQGSGILDRGLFIDARSGTTIDTGIYLGGSGTITTDIVLSDDSTIIDSGGVSVASTGGAGAVVGATCTAAEYGVNGIHKTVLTIGTLGNIVLENKDDGNGIKIYDFPAGYIQITGATCNLVATSDAAITTAYAMALGSTVGADGTATLTGTQADVIASTAITCGAGNEDFHGAPATTSNIDGTSTEMDLYVNAAVGNANISGTSNVTVTSGTITIYWINLGDY